MDLSLSVIGFTSCEAGRANHTRRRGDHQWERESENVLREKQLRCHSAAVKCDRDPSRNHLDVSSRKKEMT
jgi:hypothetical protein